jgi:hypothetical protein
MQMNSCHLLQNWLGKIIAQPLQKDERLPQRTPFGMLVEQEAREYIAESPTLKPHERVEIYYQQYWRRLLKCMELNFPSVVRLFGQQEFRCQLAVPYLSQFPPSHWSLECLGETFPQWLKDHYRETDNYLVVTSAEIDAAARKALTTKHLKSIKFFNLKPEEMITAQMVLQPHIRFFNLEGDFFAFREQLLKHEPAYYNTSPFPEISYGNLHFILYRSPCNVVSWKKVSEAEYGLLLLFKHGNTIENVCYELEEVREEWLEESLSQFPFWFQQWTVLEWFGQSLSS